MAWFSVDRSAFHFTAAEPASYRSSDHATRRFCEYCGTQITFESDQHPEEIDIASATLDEPEQVPVTDHVHDGTRLFWIRIDDGLPRYPGARPG